MYTKFFKSLLLTVFIISLHTMHAMQITEHDDIQKQSLREQYSTSLHVSCVEKTDQLNYTVFGVTKSGEEDTLTLSKLKSSDALAAYSGTVIHWSYATNMHTFPELNGIDQATTSDYWYECEQIMQ